jgi:oligopeptide/dipeptide ABC transporter ATP-binding protein
MSASSTPLLEADNLVKNFDLSGPFSRSNQVIHAVDGVSLRVDERETLAVVGESGCGKSTLGRLLMRLIDPTGGSIRLEGVELTDKAGRQLLPYRRKLQMIFQDPYGSLNPRMTVQETLADLLRIHGIARGSAARQRVGELLETVGLPASSARRYPHEFSGGQRQRIGIARALAVNPRLIVCDEAVSALDVSVQAQIINLLEDIQLDLGLSYLFISHDLMVVRHMADRVMVMYLGRVVETGDTETVFRRPRHPYTRALLDVMPVPSVARRDDRIVLKGDIPNPLTPPSGCHFHPRCPFAVERCRVEAPALENTGEGLVSCHRWRQIPAWIENAAAAGSSRTRLERLQARFVTDTGRTAGEAATR